ncbi:hypothetical protein R1flu_028596 [Riccia fluitans]|uniref:Uncharacterized protein n=1 Tax=Riccia fluitans TaxID=41844 RepID=A0ABD1XMT2_9MARC
MVETEEFRSSLERAAHSKGCVVHNLTGVYPPKAGADEGKRQYCRTIRRSRGQGSPWVSSSMDYSPGSQLMERRGPSVELAKERTANSEILEKDGEDQAVPCRNGAMASSFTGVLLRIIGSDASHLRPICYSDGNSPAAVSPYDFVCTAGPRLVAQRYDFSDSFGASARCGHRPANVGSRRALRQFSSSGSFHAVVGLCTRVPSCLALICS